ncbi:hypothetical protein J6590_022592 [Homalodisca vitripennis]|nr:hypothetical protein J6590_022592 [Homalodisca vitripennis]
MPSPWSLKVYRPFVADRSTFTRPLTELLVGLTLKDRLCFQDQLAFETSRRQTDRSEIFPALRVISCQCDTTGRTQDQDARLRAMPRVGDGRPGSAWHHSPDKHRNNTVSIRTAPCRATKPASPLKYSHNTPVIWHQILPHRAVPRHQASLSAQILP